MPDAIEQIPLDFPEAHKLADLEGIKQDLEWVINVGEKYNSLIAKYAFIELEAFCAAMIIRYARTHVSGDRRRVYLGIVKSLSSDQQEDHKYFMNLRDKFIAHSVNNFEENFSVAYIKNVKSLKPEFDQVSVHHSRLVSLAVSDINKLVLLAKVLLEKINNQVKIEKDIVTSIIKLIPIKRLIKNGFPSSALTRESAGKKRNRKTVTHDPNPTTQQAH